MSDDYVYSDEPDFWTAKAMLEMGGGFVQLVAQLWFKGDMQNRAKVRRCFSNYFEEYTEYGKAKFRHAYPGAPDPDQE